MKRLMLALRPASVLAGRALDWGRLAALLLGQDLEQTNQATGEEGQRRDQHAAQEGDGQCPPGVADVAGGIGDQLEAFLREEAEHAA